MTYFSKIITLYMAVNKLSRNQMAHLIRIPPSAMRRLIEGKTIKSDELITLVDFLFAEIRPESTMP